jgi:putative Ig domain-containing protein
VCLLAFVVVPCRLAFADVISLAWDPNSAPTAGYKLHVGNQSGSYTQHFDVGAATPFNYTNAVAGQRYCFAVTAYSSPEIESPTLNEVCGYSNRLPVLTNPGNQSSTAGQQTTLQLAATDPDGQAVTYSATGLPPGLSLGASTGFISGSGTTADSYGVQVTASDGAVLVTVVHVGDDFIHAAAANDSVRARDVRDSLGAGVRSSSERPGAALMDQRVMDTGVDLSQRHADRAGHDRRVHRQHSPRERRLHLQSLRAERDSLLE